MTERATLPYLVQHSVDIVGRGQPSDREGGHVDGRGKADDDDAPPIMLLTMKIVKTGVISPLVATMLLSKAINHFTTLLSFMTRTP